VLTTGLYHDAGISDNFDDRMAVKYVVFVRSHHKTIAVHHSDPNDNPELPTTRTVALHYCVGLPLEERLSGTDLT